MNMHTFDIKTLRLALSGALIGIAIVGLAHVHAPYHDIIGGIIGFVATLIAKARHIF